MATVSARISVAISFIIISISGAGLVFASWSSQSVTVAMVRASLFIFIMAVVHVAGYLLYMQQVAPAHVATEPPRSTFGVSPLYSSAFGNALFGQALLGLLTALVLDGGRLFGFFKVALLAEWIVICLIVFRRPKMPTNWDLSFIRIGIVPLFLMTGVIATVVWMMIGESDLSGWQRLLSE